jgi:hypothetical protein
MIDVTLNYFGLNPETSLHLWEVVDSDGTHVGWNQSENGPE